MLLYILHHPYHYELENLCRVFYPNETLRVIKEPFQVKRAAERFYFRRARMTKPIVAITQMKNQQLSVKLYHNAQRAILHSPLTENNELRLAQMLFTLLKQATGYTPPWGLLTGVRPSKLMLRLRREEGEREALQYFRETLWVSEEKTALASNVAQTEEPILALSKKNSFSLYISIPFCPSRCAYCSFVSHTIERSSAQKLIPAYVERLCEEIAYTGSIAQTLGLQLESVYIGGGTPTSLDTAQLSLLCQALCANFDMQSCVEFTAEAGRADTITEEKLLVLREYGVSRLSINPQSMRDEVLALAKRNHTAEDCLRCFALARRLGFGHINMDLIAGLPGDNPVGFQYSLETLLTLRPENITVHTLALKRAAFYAQEAGARHQEAGVTEMLAAAGTLLPAAGYAPYYMYRQSRTLGNLENIGWALPEAHCRYNIDMMEESHTILACGAGGVTKCKQWATDHLERIFSLKYPYEYLRRFEELMARKERIKGFYAAYNS